MQVVILRFVISSLGLKNGLIYKHIKGCDSLYFSRIDRNDKLDIVFDAIIYNKYKCNVLSILSSYFNEA